MTQRERLDRFLGHLISCPLIASVQASEGPLDGDEQVLTKLAQASYDQGVRVFRAQVGTVPALINLPDTMVIGLVKRRYPDSEVYITPTSTELDMILATGCEVIAIDATLRRRPGNQSFGDLCSRAHQHGCLVMADCDDLQSADEAARAGADIISTTLSGYTQATLSSSPSPDIELVRKLAGVLNVPIVAEGRYSQPWQAQAAKLAGASAVVIGGALNDPVKQSRVFKCALQSSNQDILAFDLGGTWLRAACFSPDWKPCWQERIPLPQSRKARLEWMYMQYDRGRFDRVGIASGGTIDPASGEVIETKGFISEHLGTNFRELFPNAQVFALNDGLATAWGHACLPEYAGKQTVTLALGTGIGCGAVFDGKPVMGPHGEYPRLNDLATPFGGSCEEILGGLSLSSSPGEDSGAAAQKVAQFAIETVRMLYCPDEVIVCGGVGLSDWLRLDERRSPFGQDAGLFGAAALALFPITR